MVVAAVIRKSGEPPKVEEIQVDPPKSSEVRIKMLCASLCHTDILCCNGLPVVSIHIQFCSFHVMLHGLQFQLVTKSRFLFSSHYSLEFRDTKELGKPFYLCSQYPYKLSFQTVM